MAVAVPVDGFAGGLTLADAVLVEDEVAVAEVLPAAPSDHASDHSSEEMARQSSAEAAKARSVQSSSLPPTSSAPPASASHAQPPTLPARPPPSAPPLEPPSAPPAAAATASPPPISSAAASAAAAADDPSLPYGGDLQAAMRAQDRAAIRALMDLKRLRAQGAAALPPLPLPPTGDDMFLDLPAVPTMAVPSAPSVGAEDDEIAALEAKLAALKAAKAGLQAV